MHLKYRKLVSFSDVKHPEYTIGIYHSSYLTNKSLQFGESIFSGFLLSFLASGCVYPLYLCNNNFYSMYFSCFHFRLIIYLSGAKKFKLLLFFIPSESLFAKVGQC